MYIKPGSSVQILYAIFVCVLFLGFVSYYKPYEEDSDDTFSFMSFICLVFTLVLGLALVSSSSSYCRPPAGLNFEETLPRLLTKFELTVLILTNSPLFNLHG